MRVYTTIEQSRKLTEILSLESADMCYPYDRHLNKMYGDIPYVMGYKKFNEDTDFPAWSLAALLDVLESEINSEYGETYLLNIIKDDIWWYIDYIKQYDGSSDIETTPTEELIDACYEMILKLKELNFL